MSIPNGDNFYSSKLFQDFFRLCPQSFLCKADWPRFTILAVSDLGVELVSIPREQMIGRGAFEVFPGTDNERSGRDSVQGSFERVISCKKADRLPLLRYEVSAPGTQQTRVMYWEHCNEPLFDEAGQVAYLVNTSTDITADFLETQFVKVSAQELENEQVLNEELTAANEELAATNEELAAINDELKQTQLHLAERTNKLAASEETLRIATESASVGTWSMTPEGEWLTTPQVKRIFGLAPQDRLTYADCLSQIRPDCVGRVNAAVAASRSRNEQFDVYYPITEKSQGKERWIHSIGKMISNGGPFNGHFFGALVDVTDVIESQQAVERLNKELAAANEEQTAVNEELSATNQELVQLRYAAEQAGHTLRVAVEAADFGTWHIDAKTRKMISNGRLKEIFGLAAEDEPELSAYISQITEDQRAAVTAAIERSITQGGTYDLTYSVRSKRDDSLRWVRAVGSLKADVAGDLTDFTGIVLDITEQKADDQRKNDFIGMVSHELKTPLTTIGGYLQILQSRAKKADDTVSVGMFEKTGQQVTKMTNMINGFLNVSRLASGKIQIDLQRFDLAELVKETEEEMLSTLSSHKIAFATVEQTWIHADRDKIAHVISNLVSNAVKYSPAGTTIRVACITKQGKAVMSVQDQGQGISAEDLPRLFERYYRVKEVQNTTIAGFGIGLYLCYEIIQRHEGKIWAESEYGKGSTFYFSLPVVN